MFVPLGLLAWVEALACEQVMRPLGGHVLYDATIPLSLLALYAYGRAVQPQHEKKRD